MDQDVYIQGSISTVGYTNITVGYHVARTGGSNADTECYVEAGSTRLNTHDIYITHENESIVLPFTTWNSTAVVRFETWGLNPDACCYWYFMYVTGVKMDSAVTTTITLTAAPTTDPTTAAPTKQPSTAPTDAIMVITNLTLELNLAANATNTTINDILNVINTTTNEYFTTLGTNDYLLTVDIIDRDGTKLKVNIVVTSADTDIVVDLIELTAEAEDDLINVYGDSIIYDQGSVTDRTSTTLSPKTGDTTTPKDYSAVWIIIVIVLVLLTIALIIFYIKCKKDKDGDRNKDKDKGVYDGGNILNLVQYHQVQQNKQQQVSESNILFSS